MSSRVTEKQVRETFARFAKVFGLKLATSYNDVGGYALSHAPMYGGWNIEQVMNDAGAITKPFGMTRVSSREFVEAMRFAMTAKYESARSVEVKP
jgi:hypothetical protein